MMSIWHASDYGATQHQLTGGVRVSCKEADTDMIVANTLLLLEAGLVLWLVGVVLLRGLCHMHRVYIPRPHARSSVVVIVLCHQKYVVRSARVIWRVMASSQTHASCKPPPKTGGAHRSESVVRRVK